MTGFANSALVRQQTFGQVLVAKIVPLAHWVDDATRAADAERSRLEELDDAGEGLGEGGFDDAEWRPVQSIGGIESSVDLFQWNADAGLYNWPGYDGISGYLAHMKIPARGILAHYAGRGEFDNLEALTPGNLRASGMSSR